MLPENHSTIWQENYSLELRKRTAVKTTKIGRFSPKYFFVVYLTGQKRLKLDFHTLPQLPLDRRWRNQEQPLPVVVAVLARDRVISDAGERHYLLIQRKGETYGGQWALVGGKWDFGETIAQAICREVNEETGLAAEFVSVLGIVNERLAPTGDDEIGAHFLIFVCQLQAKDGVASEQREGAVNWFTWSQIEALEAAQTIIPSDFKMLQNFAETAVSAPHFEVEMVAALGTEHDNAAQLIRFERIG
jgi:ADP-ribose pyrophosphatase YjhB (NUDIX family)